MLTSISTPGAEQNSQSASSQWQRTAEQGLDQKGQQDQLAREWGLTAQEYERYQLLMQGPRGIYSPGLDPLTALGIEARSNDERQRYAELQVKAERQRVEKELAFQRAYDEANARMYPGEKVIQISSNPGNTGAGGKAILEGDGRLAIFVKDDCAPCIDQVRALQAAKRSFDLYFVGSQGDDDRIRRWAILAGIEPANVKSRQITLNHDQGRWLGLGLGGELPAAVMKVNGQWQRQ
uniref:TIGR03759 family integrating conjugative element protein n=1 Tax=Pseudomonas sp. RW407 TaxID=2202894 RepID=UPI0021149075|nr:TIGR03759 family integrating conjugative element protein [Pseudomonas sp. RW407]